MINRGKVFAARESGMKPMEIAELIGCSVATVRRILKDAPPTRRAIRQAELEHQALEIAVKILVEAGVCRYDSPAQCRMSYVNQNVCDRCIEAWLLAKAREELRKELIT